MIEWDVTGYESDSDAPVCSAITSQQLPINALFSHRGDTDLLTWQYSATIQTDDFSALRFESLSPFCSVAVNGEEVLQSNNAFIPVTLSFDASAKSAQLTLTFKPYKNEVLEKQPRPRWKSAIAHNNHRAIRHSLLGSIEGWANSGPGIGILGEVSLPSLRDRIHIRPIVESSSPHVIVSSTNAQETISAIRVYSGENLLAEYSHQVETNPTPDSEFRLDLPALTVWQPHTHGVPNVHDLRFVIETNLEKLSLKQSLGFKQIEALDLNSPRFIINGCETFIRGACWTHTQYPDYLQDAAKTRLILERAQSLGLNMIRVTGTMGYQPDHFYELCDELGLCVWQDFAFANFDYPTDESFLSSVKEEVEYQVRRLVKFSCITAFCGNSEVQQQATMVGQPSNALPHVIFDQIIPEILQNLAPEVPYMASSPIGGALPIQTNTGIAHYFGYGAYKRSEDDLKTSDVHFASECLGLSHVPSETFNQTHFQQKYPAPHLPIWKSGVSRDASTGWDFEDIRDHYIQQYFDVDPLELRSVDLQSYHEKSRIVSGYMMAQAFNYWRSSDSNCQGAISWWLNDLLPGAGWGLIDSDGGEKPSAKQLKWQLQPVHVSLIPNGLNGHRLSLINETDNPISGTVTLACIQTNRNATHQAEVTVELSARSSETMNLTDVYGHFVDSTYAYKFGSQAFDVVGAHWQCSDGQILSHAQFPTGLSLPVFYDSELFTITTRLIQNAFGMYLEVTTNRVISFATLTVKGARLLDNCITLLPDLPMLFEVDLRHAADTIQGTLEGENIGFRHRFSVEVPRT